MCYLISFSLWLKKKHSSIQGLAKFHGLIELGMILFIIACQNPWIQGKTVISILYSNYCYHTTVAV